MITPTVPNNNGHYYPYTHSPHTAPDPQVNAEPDLYSHQQHHYVLPPHSPHTTSTIPSTNSPALSQYHNSTDSVPSTHAPHTTPAQFTSMNPSPQVGDIQLDFIPLPTAQASAPPQPYTVPDADDSAKYEASISTPLTSPSYQHSSAPSPFPEYANGHYTSYEDQQQHQQPYVLPPPTSPYPVPPSHPILTSQQSSYDNVTFVEATAIDLSDGKYKMSPSADGSTFIQNLRNPRKKDFWILLIIILAIIFGALGATVWNPDSKNDNTEKPTNGVSQRTPAPTTSARATGPPPSNPGGTPVGTAAPTAVVVPTPVTVSTGPVPPPTVTNPTNPDHPTTTRDPPPTSKPTTPTGSKDEYFRCAGLCNSTWSSCLSSCESSDAAYKSCVAPCNNDFNCEVNCKNSNGCLKGCDDAVSRCNKACPSFTS